MATKINVPSKETEFPPTKVTFTNPEDPTLPGGNELLDEIIALAPALAPTLAPKPTPALALVLKAEKNETPP